MADCLRFEPFDRKRHERGGFDCGVPAFYARHGFQSLVDDRLHLYLPMETARRVVTYPRSDRS